MIVVLANATCGCVAYAVNILLCEVQNEEEAFGEMRRFLQINNIDSDVTYVETVEEKQDCLGRIIPKHKEVEMYKGNSEYTAYDVTAAAFSIYSQIPPNLHELGTLEDWGLCEKRDWETREIHIEKHRISTVGIESGEWYRCVQKYFADLACRKVGDE